VKVLVAGVGSALPAASVARTEKTCWPSASAASVVGDVHAATKGPILTRLDVDDTWQDATATKGNLDDYKADAVHGGHAVAIVGYKPGRFIVRNSWGTTWGDKGFAYASLAYAQEAFTEAYGVEV